MSSQEPHGGVERRYTDAWSPLRSIKIHCTTLHGIHCILSRSIEPRCMESTAFNQDAFYHAESNPLHSVTLHGIPCIQSGCIVSHGIESTAFNHAAWNPLHSIMLH